MEVYPILQNEELNQAYIGIVQKLNNAPLIHIGIRLPLRQTQELYKNMTGKEIYKSSLNMESSFYFSQPYFEAEHRCHYIFLISNYEEEISQSYFQKEVNKIFWKYPQLIITDEITK